MLDEAGLKSAAERSVAATEATAFEDDGQKLRLKRHPYRNYIIERVSIPLAQESWLTELFGETSNVDLLQQSRLILKRWQSCPHERWPESWHQWLLHLEKAFSEGKNVRPLSWRQPEMLDRMLKIVHGLTSCEWSAGTLVRDVSQQLVGESKTLERHRSAVESALKSLFGETTLLESLGLICTQSRALLQGPLTLHFPDGSTHQTSALQGDFTLRYDDLKRATHATTSATRLLSIENAKTTFIQATQVNLEGNVLLLATTYPNAATIQLLKLLPAELTHHHFGDTDVSGYAILRTLREASLHYVHPFLMDWRDQITSKPLNEHDRSLLPALLQNENMQDCWPHLEVMQKAGRKGLFEQESYSAPTLQTWPFWKEALSP